MKIILLFCCALLPAGIFAQAPCATDPVYRQFDFWLGECDVFDGTGKKVGDSKITCILNSCALQEEWKSTVLTSGFYYSGKSLNTYNARTRQWQQTWVDNAGGSLEYLYGRLLPGRMEFITTPFQYAKGTMAIRRLSFFNLNDHTVRQLEEISMDSGLTWSAEYDLQYRRKTRLIH